MKSRRARCCARRADSRLGWRAWLTAQPFPLAHALLLHVIYRLQTTFGPVHAHGCLLEVVVTRSLPPKLGRPRATTLPHPMNGILF